MSTMPNQPAPKMKAIILDIGNVLVFHDNQLLYRRLGELGGLSAEAVERLVSRGTWDSLHRDGSDALQIRRQVCAALGLDLDPQRFDEVFNSHFTPNDAIAPIVETLIGRVQLVALSNTNAIHAEYLRDQLPLLGKFDHLLFSHELGWIKPDPRIYREALRRTGAKPSEAAFFDDIPEFVEAARQLGIAAYVYRSAEEFAGQLAALGLR